MVATGTIYSSEAGRDRLRDYYEQYIRNLDHEVEREYVETRFGVTHVLVAGPKEGKPLFIFQGGNCINPMTLSWFSSLLENYRIYAPDTIGHPGFSAETRLSGKDKSYAWWTEDLMEHWGIKKAAFAGSSFGGGVILRVASFLPERISCAILFAPAGIILGSKLAMIRKILVPLMLFKASGSKKQLRKIADEMSLGHMSEMDAAIIGEIFRSVKLEQEMPKLTTKDELENFESPTMLIAGTEDIFFPGEPLIEQAKQVIPNLVNYKLYKNGHFSSAENLIEINGEMRRFLAEHYKD